MSRLRMISTWLARQFEAQELIWCLGMVLLAVGIGHWSWPAASVVSGSLLLGLSWPRPAPVVAEARERPRRIA